MRNSPSYMYGHYPAQSPELVLQLRCIEAMYATAGMGKPLNASEVF